MKIILKTFVFGGRVLSQDILVKLSITIKGLLPIHKGHTSLKNVKFLPKITSIVLMFLELS